MEPLTPSILAIMYFGDVVFAVSGALTAARYRMDVMGFSMIGTITGIGGGTIRDILLGRTVWWTENPTELILCAGAAATTYFLMRWDLARRGAMIWFDALGLAAFAVVGCRVSLDLGTPWPVAVFMGMISATGGGFIRDVLTNTQPMILRGELYASAALAGSLSYAGLWALAIPEWMAEAIAVSISFGIRASAVIFGIRMGPPGEFLRIGREETVETVAKHK